MIQHLIAAIAARLQNNFDGVQVLTTTSKTPHATLPTIVILPGNFILPRSGKDLPLEPRPKDVRQTITKTSKTKTQTYPLNYIAIPNTVNAALLKTGSPPEALIAETDFIVDYQKSTLTLPSDKVAVNDDVLIGYTCAQTTIQRQFEQELWINIHDTSLANAEKWASLTCGVILGCVNELLDTFNNQTAPYRENLFTTIHQLRTLELLEGSPLPTEMGPGYQLKFYTSGELRMMRQLSELPSTIQEVIINQNFG